MIPLAREGAIAAASLLLNPSLWSPSAVFIPCDCNCLNSAFNPPVLIAASSKLTPISCPLRTRSPVDRSLITLLRAVKEVLESAPCLAAFPRNPNKSLIDTPALDAVTAIRPISGANSPTLVPATLAVAASCAVTLSASFDGRL